MLSCGCLEADEAWHTCESRERLRWRTIVESVLDDVASQEACFEELFAHFGRPSSWTCFPDVEPALAALRRGRISPGRFVEFRRAAERRHGRSAATSSD